VTAAALFLPQVAHRASWRDIDFAGAVTLAATLVPLLVGFSITRDHAFNSPEVVALLAVAVAMGLLFYVIERRTAHPIVPFELWKNPTFAVSAVTGFFIAFGMFGAILYVNLIYQGVLGIPATNSGLLVTPLMVGMIVASVVSGQLIVRITRYRYLGTAGIAVMVVGLWLLSQVGVGSPETDVVRDLVLVGIGMGVSMPLYLNAVQSALPRQYLGVVSSQVQFWRNIGGTVGIALLGAVMSHQLPVKIRTAVATLDLPPQAAALVNQASSSPQAIFDPNAIAAVKAQLPAQFAPLFDQVLIAIRGALASAMHDVFVYAAAIVALAVVVSLFLQEVPLRGREREERVARVPAFGD
jgi:hypothetical protein